MLDIAAGHGLFGITITQRHPGAEIVAVDWKPVLAVAEEHARAAQVQDRYRTLPGDAFKVDCGTGYDVALVTNSLHHVDQPTRTKFLARCHELFAIVRAFILMLESEVVSPLPGEAPDTEDPYNANPTRRFR